MTLAEPTAGDSETSDVLIIGGGPAGAAAGYWLAKLGHRATIVERKTFPRDKTCGDGLTPRAVHQLTEMGLGQAMEQFHRFQGLRATGMGRSLDLAWPEHPVYPQHGYVVRRRVLDALVADNAVAAGARLLQGHEAVEPISERGFVRGAVVHRADGSTVRMTARYVLVADGANSRFGRALGTFRTRSWPYGTAIRTYWRSPRHAEPWIESALGIEDVNGKPMPGYGWVFPVGDGTINVGVGLLSSFRDFRSVNTTRLLDAYARQIADRWGIDPDHPETKPKSGRIPMGGSVGPKAGPTYLLVGDAAGSVNPFNGEGIDYAYETARLAAEVLHDALSRSDPAQLQRYPRELEERYGEYFKVARLFARVIGRPTLMRELTRVGMRSQRLMSWALRIMANLMRDDDPGAPERIYRAAALLAKVAPKA